jgi:hypothetical protein
MLPERDVDSFVRLVDALRPQLPNLVFIGGWAHRLHRLHIYAQPLDYAPLMTKDVDVAVPIRGFPEADLRAGGFYAEFLTTLEGGEYRRDGTSDVTTKIGNVSAQKLRHLDVLLQSSWSVRLQPENGFPFSEPTEIRIPNAASYLAKKILIHGKRRAEDKARDILYIHDTIDAFGQALERLHAVWHEHVRAHLHTRAAAAVENAHVELFGRVSDVIREASIQARGTGRELSPETIRLVGELGLRQIFG